MKRRPLPALKPTPADLSAAAGRTVPDVIAPKLRVLFCGINPSLYSGFTGHHFARPGNRFWSTLHAAGFTDRLLAPAEERQLLDYGYGVTNLVNRATASAAELTREELIAGAEELCPKVERYRPGVVAIVGVSAFRTAFARPNARVGRKRHCICSAGLWVLPNPSGLNAHYTPTKLARAFRTLRLHLERARR